MTTGKTEPARRCPGERYDISPAICRTRQQNQYPKCLLCPSRDAEMAGSMPTDPKVPAGIFRGTRVLGRAPQEINDYVVRKVGLAAAQVLRADDPAASRMVVGHDLRENSRSFARAFCEGVGRNGMHAVHIGAVTPELIAFVLGMDGFSGGAFIGGGNHPESFNGIRLMRPDGRLIGAGTGLEKVAAIARRMRPGCSRTPGHITSAEPVPDYVAYMRKFVPRLSALKVVLDAGNGPAGRLVRQVLAGGPVELTALRFDEEARNGSLGRPFPSEDVVAAVAQAVGQAGANLGAAVDFNGERIAFFDERGRLLRHDVVCGLIATEMLARNPEGCVTHDLRFSSAVGIRVRERGGQAVSAPTSRLAFGQHFRRSDGLYGADGTGLHYFRDFFRFPSPVLALLMMCSHLSRENAPVSQLAEPFLRFEQSGEVTIPLPAPEVGPAILDEVRDEFPHADRELIDGLTVRTQDWWFNLRQPGKAAELRLNVEGKTSRDLRRARQTAEKAIQQALAAHSA